MKVFAGQMVWVCTGSLMADSLAGCASSTFCGADGFVATNRRISSSLPQKIARIKAPRMVLAMF